jgi:hypothetical protein
MPLFRLSSDVVAVVLSSWIDMQALAKLDSALCASKQRAQFLGILGVTSFVADAMWTCSSTSQERYVQHVEWLMKRRLKVRRWIVSREASVCCSPDLVRFCAGPHVRSLRLLNFTSAKTARVFSTLVVACSGVQRLELQDCAGWEAVSTLSALAQQSLKELILDCCTSRGWVSRARFANLRKLHVRYLTGMEDVPSVISLLNAAPNLTDFQLWSASVCPINNTSLRILSNHAAALEILVLDSPHQEYSSAAVVSLAERCTNLKTLRLMCGYGVDDAAVEAFARHCSRLEGLQLWGPFSSESLTAVALHCGARLRYLALDMEYCEPDGLTAIAQHCSLLEELQLYNGGILTRKPIIQLVSSLPRLRELLLNTFSGISDEVLIAIAAHLPHLQHLGLSGYQRYECGYTEAGAQALVTSLTQLQRFCIRPSDISAFTPAMRKRWQKASPGLQIYYRYQASTRYFERLGL